MAESLQTAPLRAALDEVLTALEAERSALESRDADGLLAASQRKADALGRVAALGLADGAVRGPEGAGGELTVLLDRCRTLNESNGALIRGQRRRVEGTLRVLFGGAGDAAPDVYGRNGGTQFHAPSRGPLASC